MKDKKNVIIAILVVIVVLLLWPGLFGSVLGLAWKIFKFVVIALAIIIIVSLVLKKRNS